MWYLNYGDRPREKSNYGKRNLIFAVSLSTRSSRLWKIVGQNIFRSFLSIFFSYVNVCCIKVKQILCSVTFLYRAEIQLSMLVKMCWNRYRLCYVILFFLSAV